MTQATITFKVMTDEHISNAVVQQLVQKGIDATRLIDVLPVGTPDPELLEFCYQNGFTLITLDERMRKHITTRINQGDKHAGVFMGSNHLQGRNGIGVIVNFVLFYHEAILAAAATLEDDVYNRIITIT